VTKKVPVPLRIKEDNTMSMADYFIVCRNASANPEVFITKPENIKDIHKGEKNGNISYWLQPHAYEMFKYNWADESSCVFNEWI